MAADPPERLLIPYLKQAMLGSCGPACTTMVQAWLEGRETVQSGTDVPPWFRSWLFPFGMTEAFGLASLLVRAGVSVIVFKERPEFHLQPRTGTNFDRVVTAFGHVAGVVARRRKAQALRKGVRLVLGPVTMELLRKQLARGRPAITMVNQGAYAPDPDWPGGVLHWVVVTSMNDERVVFHDPDLGPLRELPGPSFERAMDVAAQGMDRQMVVVEPTPGFGP